MKTNTQSRRYQIEVSGVPGLILTISVSAESSLLSALDTVGVGPTELHNYIQAKLDEIRDTLDGSVQGLVVSNLEE
jgi:hypothetical protein